MLLVLQMKNEEITEGSALHKGHFVEGFMTLDLINRPMHDQLTGAYVSCCTVSITLVYCKHHL